MVHLRSTVRFIEFLQSVGNPKGGDRFCGVMAKGVDRRKDGALALRVKQGGGFVEKEKPSVAGQSAGNGQPLFLPSAEGMDGPGC